MSRLAYDATRHETQPNSRSRRVQVLIAAIVVLSLVDLVATLHAMHTTGMSEANPLVAWLARSTGSTMAIIFFKVASVGACGALLHRVRAFAQAEVAAWGLTVVLSGLAVQWVAYEKTMSQFDPVVFEQLAELDPSWVRLGDHEPSGNADVLSAPTGSDRAHQPRFRPTRTVRLTPPGAGLSAGAASRG